MSGDRVVWQHFENRLQKAIKKQTDKGKKFDYVAILGGNYVINFIQIISFRLFNLINYLII